MTVPIPKQKSETMLAKEIRIFREQISRLGNCFLNKVFDLSTNGSQRRSLILTVLTVTLAFIFSLSVHPLVVWGTELRLFFQQLFIPTSAQSSSDAITRFIAFSFGAVFGPQTYRYLPLFILPFIIALQSAATFLADIFEIEKIGIARNFISQVALTGNFRAIRIGKGEVIESHKNSPIYLIGGPGRVTVDLDTAVLFEKPNGQPRVIGPTIRGKVKLEGFERFRQAVDLRDQHTDSLNIKSRSLDGIPISTEDVRMVFSVWRGDQQPSIKSPHPFNEKAIESLVYGQASRVILDGPNPSEPPSSWVGTIQGLIRGRLGGFMSKHRLAAYLASIGLPEVERAREQEDEIVKVGQTVIAEDNLLEPNKIPNPPEIQARNTVSNLFGKFAEDFTKNASQRGVELGWIGVGTWKTPSDIVPEKQLEAWKISRENIKLGGKAALGKMIIEAKLQQLLRLVQNTPLARVHQNSGKDHKDAVQDLLIGYREQLIETIVLLKKSNQKVPAAVNAAIKHIENVLGIKHWVGGAGPASGVDAPSPSPTYDSNGSNSGLTTGVPSIPPISPEEEDVYEDLFQKVSQDAERVESLIDHERKNAPNADRMELIQRAITHWLKDNR